MRPGVVAVVVEGRCLHTGRGRGRHGGRRGAFRIGPVAIVERVVELVPGERFAYALLSGLPVRNYRADVVLTRDGERTRIDWGASFDTAAGLGWAMRALLRRILGDITAALVRRTGS